jgi:hypothetical protein
MNGYAELQLRELHAPSAGKLWLLLSGTAMGANGPNSRMRYTDTTARHSSRYGCLKISWGAFDVTVTADGFNVEGDYYRQDSKRRDRYVLYDNNGSSGVTLLDPRLLKLRDLSGFTPRLRHVRKGTSFRVPPRYSEPATGRRAGWRFRVRVREEGLVPMSGGQLARIQVLVNAARLEIARLRPTDYRLRWAILCDLNDLLKELRNPIETTAPEHSQPAGGRLRNVGDPVEGTRYS